MEAAPAAPSFVRRSRACKRLRAFWIAADQAAQFLHSRIALAKLQQSIALFQLRGSGLVSARILVQDLVISLDGAGEISLAISNLSQIELRVAGQIGVAINLQILRELLRGQVVLVGVVVAQSVVIELVGGRGLRERWLSQAIRHRCLWSAL